MCLLGDMFPNSIAGVIRRSASTIFISVCLIIVVCLLSYRCYIRLAFPVVFSLHSQRSSAVILVLPLVLLLLLEIWSW
jgi:hypothetical protein